MFDRLKAADREEQSASMVAMFQKLSCAEKRRSVFESPVELHLSHEQVRSPNAKSNRCLIPRPSMRFQILLPQDYTHTHTHTHTHTLHVYMFIYVHIHLYLYIYTYIYIYDWAVC